MVNSPTNRPPFHRRGPSSAEGSAARVIPTNTLILTPLPSPLFHPTIQDSLRAHFSTYGDLRTWVPLAGLGRVIAVFGGWGSEDEEKVEGVKAAVMAKSEMDRFVISMGDDHVNVETPAATDRADTLAETIRKLPRIVLRVYFGPSTSLAPCPPSHLSPPDPGQNFLISPPGSPPVGWVQTREEGPNKETLADDLARALRFLTVGEGAEIESGDPTRGGSSDSEIPQDLVILSTSPDSSVPSLRVQATDASPSLPDGNMPGKISRIKATVDSMRGSVCDGPTAGFGSGQRITPTARPPSPGAF